MTKRIAIYVRVSTADQHPETQLFDLRKMAKQRAEPSGHRIRQLSRKHRHGRAIRSCDDRNRRSDCRAGTQPDRRKSQGGNAKSEIGRTANRPQTAGYRPRASCRRSSLRHVAESSGEEASNFEGERVPVGEGIRRYNSCPEQGSLSVALPIGFFSKCCLTTGKPSVGRPVVGP